MGVAIMDPGPSAEEAGDALIMQWRGSLDGVTWTEWRPLHSLIPPVLVHCERAFLFCQGRVLIDGEWRTSPIATWAGWAP